MRQARLPSLNRRREPRCHGRTPNALEWLCVCAPVLVFLVVLGIASLLAFARNGVIGTTVARLFTLFQ